MEVAADFNLALPAAGATESNIALGASFRLCRFDFG
jgi:hypothetical protein